MQIVVTICVILILIYCLQIILYNSWFTKLAQYRATPQEHYNTFTIIIPARNEAHIMDKCLQSIVDTIYDKRFVELILIDDFSDDDTLSVMQSFSEHYAYIKYIEMKNLVLPSERINSYKKLAIQKAIEMAAGNYIITTDADCMVPEGWLTNFNAFIQEKKAYFIASPVKYIDTGSFLSKFQCLDFLSLQGITAASVSAGFHSMCNGANLCYKKDIFLDLNGFKGFDHLASGDDMFLMRKFQKKYPANTHYLFSQENIVSTMPMPTISSFINQRIRWASKATSYDDIKMISVLFLVYFTNLLFPTLFILGFFWPVYFLWLVLFFIIKCIFEMIFMKNICAFFDQRRLLKYFPIAEPFHIVYTLVSGWLGKFGKYEWKGRSVQ